MSFANNDCFGEGTDVEGKAPDDTRDTHHAVIKMEEEDGIRIKIIRHSRGGFANVF